MNEPNPVPPEIFLTVLLRHARYTYGTAMRLSLAEAGYDDIPGNGMYIIGGLALGMENIPLGQLIRELRISKQAAGQLVDALVVRGYLDRATDPEDRRKLTVSLTERGRAAAAAQRSAREKIDAELLARVGQEALDCTRRTLAALIQIREERESAEESPDSGHPDDAD